MSRPASTPGDGVGASVVASAPGKLMLAGEYVVAERSAPALAIAVDRRLEVEVDALDPDDGLLRSVAPASNSGGKPSALLARWVVTSEGMGLVDAPVHHVPVLTEVLARIPGIPPAGRITIRSQLGVGEFKPGLGGSAALCAAAFSALWRISGAVGPPDLDVAIAAHRAAQGGRGSGYDVATAMHGGLVVFHPGQLARGRHNATAARIERIAWPEGLYAAAFGTGRSASTTDLLARVETWREEDAESFEACIEPLAAETVTLIDAFRVGEVHRILDAAAQVQEELATMDRIGDLGIMGGGQLQLNGAIEDHGAVGRTAGAGGGDCAWALTDDPDLLVRLTDALKGMGFVRIAPLGGPLGGPGVRVGEAG